MTLPRNELLELINQHDALATAMNHARVSGSAEAWALIAIALHVTEGHAVLDPATGRHEVRPGR